MKPSLVKACNHLTADIVRHLILAWLAAVTLECLLRPCPLDGLEGLAQMSLLRVTGVTVLIFGLCQMVARQLAAKKAERWLIFSVFALLAVSSLAVSFSWAFLAVCTLVLFLLAIYALRGWNGAAVQVSASGKEKPAWKWIILGLALAFFLFVSLWTVCRVWSFSTPTFDFGIFSQMFHRMHTTGLPDTTVERDGLLSHFKVHVSPIYYLLLPFYWLVPKPETLQVLQAAVLASAVFPLWKLGKLHGLPPGLRTLLCGLLLLFPAHSGGASYDIHENMFLSPLVLWLFYAIDSRRNWLTALFGLLTLLVKEDAAVYVAVIALWLLVRSMLYRDRAGIITALVMLLASAVWFLLVTGYLARYGDGVMTYRYDNFIYDGSSSLFTVIKAVILSPMKALYECVDTEKLYFIAMTLGPLLGMPLWTRRYERYILLIPYVLVNLMSDYPYQHDIFFQYTFGSTACLFYLTAVNLAELRLPWQRLGALTAAAAVSLGCFSAVVVPKGTRYMDKWSTYSSYYAQVRECLDLIPADASVTATTFYTTYLSQREILYDVRYSSREHLLSTEYVVLGLTDQYSYRPYKTASQDGLENLIALLEENGCQEIARMEGTLVIYQKKP